MMIVAQRVQRQIRSDAKHPRREFCARSITLSRPVNSQKDFLGQIFSRSRIPYHAVKKIHDRGSVFS
jgi:hypothetical protein